MVVNVITIQWIRHEKKTILCKNSISNRSTFLLLQIVAKREHERERESNKRLMESFDSEF